MLKSVIQWLDFGWASLYFLMFCSIISSWELRISIEVTIQHKLFAFSLVLGIFEASVQTLEGLGLCTLNRTEISGNFMGRLLQGAELIIKLN